MVLNRSRELKVLDVRSCKTMSVLLHFINFLTIEDTFSNDDMPYKRTREHSNDLSSSNFCWYYNVKECIRMKHSCPKNLFLYYVEKTC